MGDLMITKTKKADKVIKKEVVKEKAESGAVKKSDTVSIDAGELAELRKYKTIVEDADRKINAPAGKIADNDYEYFASFDKGSSVPAWSLPRQTEILENDVNKLNSMLKNKEIPIEEIAYAEADYARKKERLEEIRNSKPKLTGLQKDKLKQKRDALAEEISRSKFTRLQMEKGLVDPHEEATRMSEPCISVDKEEARRMGIKTTADGRVSRNVAEGMWKNMSSLLGDTPLNPNSEMLRGDTGHSKRNMITVPVDIKDGKVSY